MRHHKIMGWLGALALLLAGCEDGSILVQEGEQPEDSGQNGGQEGTDAGENDNGSDSGGNDSGSDEGDSGSDSSDSDDKCVDLCSLGAKKCSESGHSLVCMDINGDNCFEWSEQPCPEGESCTNGVCGNASEDAGCVDTCPENGERTCVELEDGGQGYRLCSNFNDDVCLEWSKPIACRDGQTCSEGRCGCTDVCDSAGATDCMDGGVRTCADLNGDGCLEWSDVVPCDEGTCVDGKCACNHVCELGARQCSGSGYQTCVTDGSGCRQWSGVTACEHGCVSGQCQAAPVVMAPTRYAGDRLLSPVTPYVVEQMKAIRAKNSSRKDLRFIKVGDSHMYSGSVFMYCYSKTGAKSGMTLADATFLQGAIDAFQSDTDCFHRDSVTAVLGKTMYWSLSGGYLTEEINAMNPRFAFVGYGTNDMGWYGYNKHKISGGNAGYFGTLEWYYRNMLKASEQLVSSGIIPMYIGTGIRTDQSSLEAKNRPIHYVSMFNAIARGLAEKYQVPYFNLQLSQEPLPSYGLSSDGVHHKHIDKGCTFTSDGLNAGANTRNRYAMEMLDRAWRTVIRGESAPDTETLPFDGKGTKAQPWVISSLPYTHTANSTSGQNLISNYSCSSGTNEGGPELYYRLELKQMTKIRAFAVSSTGADVDIHLTQNIDDSSCMVRGDKWFEGNLAAGTYYIVVDTFKSSANAGEYLMAVLPCDAADTACGASLIGE